MSTRSYKAQLLHELYDNIEEASDTLPGNIEDEVEEWEQCFHKGRVDLYRIIKAIQQLVLVKTHLEKARDAHFWLSFEFMEDK